MRYLWFQFYPSDWIMDTRPLSLAAKGAWMDILCFLDRTATRGEHTMGLEGWARLIGAAVEETDRILTELGQGVANVKRHSNATGNGDVTAGEALLTVTCRRMVREGGERQSTKERVARWREKQKKADSPSEKAPEAETPDVTSNGASNAGGNGDVTPKNTDTDTKPDSLRSSGSREGSGEPSRPPTPSATDEDWLKALEADPTYTGLDIRRELGKCSAWCKVRKLLPSRRRFINWLNKAERPMAQQGGSQFRGAF